MTGAQVCWRGSRALKVSLSRRERARTRRCPQGQGVMRGINVYLGPRGVLKNLNQGRCSRPDPAGWVYSGD